MSQFRFRSTGEAYDATQMREDIVFGDVLIIESERVVGLADTWPVSVTKDAGKLHTYAPGHPPGDHFAPEHIAEALRVARSLGYEIHAAFSFYLED
jgi:hypothetical protein